MSVKLYLDECDVATQQFLTNLLLIKGIHFKLVDRPTNCPREYKGPVLIMRDTCIIKIEAIILFIERTFPYPELIPTIPEAMAETIMTLMCILHKDISPESLEEYLPNRAPYILGSQINILDLVIEPLIKDESYKKLIRRSVSNEIGTSVIRTERKLGS